MKLIKRLFHIGMALFGALLMSVMILATTAPGNDNGALIPAFVVPVPILATVVVIFKRILRRPARL